MITRRRVGRWITLAAIIVAGSLTFAGVLFPIQGTRVPPTRSSTTQVGDTITTTVDVHYQPRTIRWSIAVPLGVCIVIGLTMIWMPEDRTP